MRVLPPFSGRIARDAVVDAHRSAYRRGVAERLKSTAPDGWREVGDDVSVSANNLDGAGSVRPRLLAPYEGAVVLQVTEGEAVNMQRRGQYAEAHGRTPVELIERTK